MEPQIAQNGDSRTAWEQRKRQTFADTIGCGSIFFNGADPTPSPFWWSAIDHAMHAMRQNLGHPNLPKKYPM